MRQDDPAERVTALRHQLAAEFAASLPTEVVERCFTETVDAYRSARIADFVPLLVHRDARSRLLTLARTETPAT